jgi:hypothetical protein
MSAAASGLIHALHVPPSEWNVVARTGCRGARAAGLDSALGSRETRPHVRLGGNGGAQDFAKAAYLAQVAKRQFRSVAESSPTTVPLGDAVTA